MLLHSMYNLISYFNNLASEKLPHRYQRCIYVESPFPASDILSEKFDMDPTTGRITTNALLTSFDDTVVNVWVEARDEQGSTGATVVRITIFR